MWQSIFPDHGSIRISALVGKVGLLKVIPGSYRPDVILEIRVFHVEKCSEFCNNSFVIQNKRISFASG
jgi:hypothetical protein